MHPISNQTCDTICVTDCRLPEKAYLALLDQPTETCICIAAFSKAIAVSALENDTIHHCASRSYKDCQFICCATRISKHCYKIYTWLCSMLHLNTLNN